MPYQLWTQDNFSRGELSPFMYARAQIAMYYDGLKVAQNVLNYPTGAAGKRFGTLYQATLTGLTSFNQLYFETFQWLDNAIFQLVYTPLNIAIYLEGILIQNVITTFDAYDVYNMSTTTIGPVFRMTFNSPTIAPYDLSVALDGGNVVLSADAINDFLTLTTPTTSIGLVLPVQFNNITPADLPTTSPQIKVNITYFVNFLTASTIAIYSTAYDAKFDLNRYTIIDVGSGTTTMYTWNVWTLAICKFKNLPFYDFNGSITSYDANTFTPGAVFGNVVITVSPAYSPLDSSYVGGAFIGGGGTGRIIAVGSTTSFTVAVQEPFDMASVAIQGSLVLLAEPAWSDKRGWPKKCSSYQNRSLFANTISLPNGFWTSVVNDYTDFGDMTLDDDDAISWFPTSNNVNVIRFIVPFRSITIHTNSGIYSSPLSEIASITPTTFTLQLQDSTPADVLQPQAIDNQIIVLSGNDVHTMVWDGINNAYTSNIVSIANEQTVRDPVDEVAYADLTRAGSRYVFIINANGSMAVFQTLQTENVVGFTPQIMEQTYGHAQFLQAASSSDGRCWFVVQRQIAVAITPIAITGFTLATPSHPSTLTAVASNISSDSQNPTAITFTTTGVLPVSLPPLNTTSYFWAVGVTVDTFMVYISQADAIAGINSINFTSSGAFSNLVSWPLSTIFTLEELSQDTHIDCAVQYGLQQGGPVSSIATGALFNAQSVVMTGDGFGYSDIGFNNQVQFNAHGQPVNVQDAFIGFAINTIIETMPLTPPPGQQNTLTKPKHIRSIRFMFNNTIGGFINGVPISLNPFDMADIGEPPIPARGFVELSMMSGWDDFNYPSFTITHSDPFNIELIGVFYSVDT